ncbi:MAG: MFS transporter [Anaerolineae bacterium]|nr:MFS transporter [Anaerolineae bacterium]
MAESDAQGLSPSFREQIYRRNFLFFLTDGILFTVAMSVIGSTTVIPDFVRRLTDSEILVGLSGSLFEISWMLPQLFIARYIIRFARKKWWFAGPNIPVRFVILIFAVITVRLGKDQPEAILLAFFICYGIAGVGDGVVAVPWADLSGTSLDARWRARVFGFQSAGTGLIMLSIAPLLAPILSGTEFPNNYALLFGISGMLFVLSIIPVLFVHELPGGKAVEKIPALSEFLPDLGQVLRADEPFRAILITRMLTSLFVMAGPFYIGFATVSLGLSSEVAVPTLLAMQTIGSVSGALAYAWLGAHNNLLYIRLALGGGALLPISALLAGMVGPLPLYLGFLISGLAVSNLGISLQNWVVTYATADRRPIYVGLFNTISAVTSLAAPIIGGTIAQNLGYRPLFAVSLVMALSALFVTLRFLRNTGMVSLYAQ